eukprot:SAG22_NODE_933_length_6434_cov_5.195264_7_plen_111_part_00
MIKGTYVLVGTQSIGTAPTWRSGGTQWQLRSGSEQWQQHPGSVEPDTDMLLAEAMMCATAAVSDDSPRGHLSSPPRALLERKPCCPLAHLLSVLPCFRTNATAADILPGA